MTAARRTFVIAEAGVNHGGSVDVARALIDAAAEAGADAVKFQTFTATRLASRMAHKAQYQVARTGAAGGQVEMLEALELSRDAHHTLAAHARDAGLEFMSSAFDQESLDFLVREVGVRRIKIPSGEITNAGYLLHAAGYARPVLLSTGMSTLEEVQVALGALAYGFAPHADAPSPSSFAHAAASADGRGALERLVTLLHCTSEYPAPIEHANLRAMNTLEAACRLPVGYSDHTPGISVAIAAVARGAVVVEKHLTLSRDMSGPDHAASLEPPEFGAMVSAIREVEQALGSPAKEPTAGELANRTVARRSLVAARPVAKGECFTAENLVAKRPGSGISPLHYWEWLGRPAARDYAEDEVIDG